MPLAEAQAKLFGELLWSGTTPYPRLERCEPTWNGSKGRQAALQNRCCRASNSGYRLLGLIKGRRPES
jgi:hypothetical protein